MQCNAVMAQMYKSAKMHNAKVQRLKGTKGTQVQHST